MRVGTLNDLQGEPVGKIIERDDGSLTGEGTGERLVQQAPGKTFDDWVRTLHHSTYLRIIEDKS
jgi:hypothetical protein